VTGGPWVEPPTSGYQGAGADTPAMASFSVNPQRVDPYKNFKFRVRWEGRTVAGISRVSGLRRRTEVIQHREGAQPSLPRKSPGLTSFDPIVLERGLTHDQEFERWANKVWQLGATSGTEVSLRDFRRDIGVEILNEAGQMVLAYRVYRCWISEYQALPDLDANGVDVAIESITLENEGWERDVTVKEPAEPSFAGSQEGSVSC